MLVVLVAGLGVTMGFILLGLALLCTKRRAGENYDYLCHIDVL